MEELEDPTAQGYQEQGTQDDERPEERVVRRRGGRSVGVWVPAELADQDRRAAGDVAGLVLEDLEKIAVEDDPFRNLRAQREGRPAALRTRTGRDSCPSRA